SRSARTTAAFHFWATHRLGSSARVMASPRAGSTRVPCVASAASSGSARSTAASFTARLAHGGASASPSTCRAPTSRRSSPTASAARGSRRAEASRASPGEKGAPSSLRHVLELPFGEVVEARVLARKAHLRRPRGAVALLGHDELRDILLRALGVVIV